jgi:hypothetical protein
MAVFNSMVHRMFSIPLTTENKQAETNIIMEIARNNGYKKEVVHNIIHKKEYKNIIYKYIYNKPKKDLDAQKWRRILFMGKLTTDTINQCKGDFKPAYYTNNQINTYIFKNKSPTLPIEDSGIYRIKCPVCNISYIGQTGRTIKTRVKEHLSAITNFSANSEMADHVRETGHKFGMDDVEVLHRCKKGYKMDIIEAIEINKNNDIINIQIPPITSPLVKLLIPSPPTTNTNNTPLPHSSTSTNFLTFP